LHINLIKSFLYIISLCNSYATKLRKETTEVHEEIANQIQKISSNTSNQYLSVLLFKLNKKESL